MPKQALSLDSALNKEAEVMASGHWILPETGLVPSSLRKVNNPLHGDEKQHSFSGREEPGQG